MDKIRCYWKDAGGLHRTDVVGVGDCEEAISAVKVELIEGGTDLEVVRRVLAVVRNG